MRWDEMDVQREGEEDESSPLRETRAGMGRVHTVGLEVRYEALLTRVTVVSRLEGPQGPEGDAQRPGEAGQANA